MRVIILGGGFGGAYCAQALERELRGVDCEIDLIDRNNYFAFYPLLIEAGTGSLEPRHAVVPIRAFLKRTRFRMAEVVAVDLARREVEFRLAGAERTERLGYDHLVLALGSVTRVPAVPGVREHAFEMKSLSDAVVLRDRAIRLLEQASATSDPAEREELLHLIVVGGNLTGVEVAGEFDVFLRAAARRFPGLGQTTPKVTLVEAGPRILNALDEGLARYAHRSMERRGIRVIVGRSVSEISSRGARLSDGEQLVGRTVVWSAGIAPPRLNAELGLPLDRAGYINCERDLRVHGHDNLWGLGDCAIKRDAKGEPYPATAQHAIREGRHAAKNIARVIRGRSTTPFDYRDKGVLAALGCRTGVARVFGIPVSGFAAWFLWRSYYLAIMPGIGRRLRVALDWTLDLFFRRDFVQLGVHRDSLP